MANNYGGARYPGRSASNELSFIDKTKDTGRGRRGFLATNWVSDLRQKAKKRKTEWTLTPIEAYYLMIGDCWYCGSESGWPAKRHGIDRTDSSIGYHKDNCVSCCWRCNCGKNNMSVNDFVEWAKKVSRWMSRDS